MIKKILSIIRKNFPQLHQLGIDIYFKFIMNIGFMKKEEFIDKTKNQIKFFVQIGANDGINNDFINTYVRSQQWKGILIEPISGPFNRLMKNYQDVDGLIFEKAAIVKEAGDIEMYTRVTDENSSVLADQISSLNKEHLIKHGVSQDEIIKETVKGITFTDLVAKYKIQNVDLLVIDAEGYDLQLIQSINFEEVSISNIMFEHTHVIRSPLYSEVIKKFKKMNYKVYRDSEETIASKTL